MISLLHPSRGRPEKSFNNAKEWIERAGCEVELIVSIDKSDNWKPYFDLYTPYPHDAKPPYWRLHMNDNDSVVQATNNAAKEATGDILLYLSDDFKCFDNWGVAVMKEFENESRPLLIKVDDMLQKFTVPVLTIPIMNRALYERLGYFWHPEYKSMWVDCDLYETVKRIGAMKFCEYLKFPHEHPANGKASNDETYTRSAANWSQGEEVFKRRRQLNFPV